jgi:hypothetical protein
MASRYDQVVVSDQTSPEFGFTELNSEFPSGNGPFSDERRSPRAYFLDVRSVRLVVSPCAALLIEKIAHFQIGN